MLPELEAMEVVDEAEAPPEGERQQWVAAGFMLWKVGRQLDRARRARWRRLACRWESELHDAWQRRDLAVCHRLSLLIAGKSKRARWRSVAGQVRREEGVGVLGEGQVRGRREGA